MGVGETWMVGVEVGSGGDVEISFGCVVGVSGELVGVSGVGEEQETNKMNINELSFERMVFIFIRQF